MEVFRSMMLFQRAMHVFHGPPLSHPLQQSLRGGLSVIAGKIPPPSARIPDRQ
jgi:hypothetical protein